MSSRTQYTISLLNDLHQRIQDHDPFDREHLAEEEQDFIDKLQALRSVDTQPSADFLFDAQELIGRFIRCYPNLVPLMQRELLYFVGGECLHFLGDEELELYQQIDEQLYEQEQAGNDVDIRAIIEANKPTTQAPTLQ
ncbi:PA2817 family protein [Marinomonas ostreistagni]|uniref:PA2817 family protein n=1 Tax=Marinomonas ostreistagni TaxID=359209 RepID=UPI00194E7155|nr:hypothetical protein [Marinomonas ostreistagni]